MADLGVPMRAGADHEGPEDAFGKGVKRGDYSNRIGDFDYDPHEGLVPQRQLAIGNVGLVAPDVAFGADLTTDYFTIPADGTVTGVVYIPDATITGAATNNRKISLINGGAAGSDSTSAAALTFGAGVNAPAGEEKTVTLGTATVAAGDKMKWESKKVGTGIADPGGTVFVAVAYS